MPTFIYVVLSRYKFLDGPISDLRIPVGRVGNKLNVHICTKRCRGLRGKTKKDRKRERRKGAERKIEMLKSMKKEEKSNA
jgi:hypothetical protein